MGEGYYPALVAAVDTNKEIITDLLVKFGRLKRDALKRACEERGSSDAELFDSALAELQGERVIISGDNDESFLLVFM